MKGSRERVIVPVGDGMVARDGDKRSGGWERSVVGQCAGETLQLSRQFRPPEEQTRSTSGCGAVAAGHGVVVVGTVV